MKTLLVVGSLIALILSSVPVAAAPADFDVPGGHFFSQASGGDSGVGYTVVDDASARFWSEFKRLGGVAGVGYPVSHRFVWDGFVVQAMQKGVLQWRPELGQAYFVNVFDQLSIAGKDGWLFTVRSTPAKFESGFDANKSWDAIVAARIALLDANPAIKAQYYSVADPMVIYGLPTSRVVDNGNHFVVRLQRAVIQQWKADVPWAKAGQVTVANGGDVGKEAGLFPPEAIVPLPPDRAQPPSRGGEGPRGTPEQVALDAINYYRTIAGAGRLKLSPALGKAAAAHASYYASNYGDKSLAGMGLHYEIPGRPGFTGASWPDRARAAGYANWAVDENIGLLGNPRKTIDYFMDTINHRWNMIHPSAVHLGYGISSKPAIDVFDFGFSGDRPSVTLPTVYPGDGQKAVPVLSAVAETPDPAPGAPRPLGYPVTISFHLQDAVTWGEFSMVDSSGQGVQLYTSQKNWLRSLALIPAKPLRPGTTYSVRVAGTVNGQPFAKRWSFTTK
ncbi:MAG: CAP domain-containing protein [Chloroflexi bacterium]|nr:CAP domain-containing protein [Chloroflexota bacterium]